MPRPDAVLIPDSAKQGATKLDRIDSILRIVEPILEVKRPPERAYIHQQGMALFITRDPRDTMKGKNGTELEGKPRYAWEAANVPGIDGLLVGRLIDYDAPPAPAVVPEPAPEDHPEEPKTP